MQNDKLVQDEDLGLSVANPLNRMVISAVKSVLGLNRLNRLYAKSIRNNNSGVDFAHAVISNLDIDCRVTMPSDQKIPEEGAFIIVANHPHGALDGLLLIDYIARVRPDVKFIGNFLLSRIKPLESFFLPVNPFNAANQTNVSGIKSAFSHLKSGGGLVIFPAGEVSTFQKGFSRCEDRVWPDSIVKFIRKAGVPVIPLYIGGRNKLPFHLVGKIHPMLRTVRLPLELVNKYGYNVNIVIGSAISPKMQKQITETNDYRDYLRASIYFLQEELKQMTSSARSSRLQSIESLDVNGTSPDVISKEVESLSAEYLLFKNGTYEVYCVPTSAIPNVLQEIGRLRELTFRAIGEGTNKDVDLDKYDEYYHHLFVWEAEKKELVGAYRVGFGDEIYRQFGVSGFYTHTLFDYSKQFEVILPKIIELGRSFIVRDYQRRSTTLLLLWRGILCVLLKHKEYSYLLGPVSTPGDYSVLSKMLVVTYLRNFHLDSKWSKCVVPRIGLRGLKTKLDLNLVKNIDSADLIDRLIRDIEGDMSSIPVLVKKYLQLNGKILGFNVDPDFNNALDALLLLDLSGIPYESIEMVSRELKSEEVFARFGLSDGDVPRETL